jgi:uncharacterized protein YggE
VVRAKAEAETAAEEMGIDLGMTLEVQASSDPGVPPPRQMYRAMEIAQSVAPTPGEQVMRANVTTRYRLLGR